MIQSKKTVLSMLILAAFSFTFIQCSDGETSSENEETPYDDSWSDKVEDINTIPVDFLADVTFKEAVNYKNLQVFMIEGETTNEEPYVPLKRAMEDKLVKIKETSDVNELKITNKSDETVFINAGDIIKGGKQNRTLAYDVIVDAGSKKTKLTSFCVESGRWNQRGNEEAGYFEENTKMLSSRDLKMSSKKEKDQSAVWAEVEETQEKLSYNMTAYSGKDVDVKSAESESSLELALDNKELKALEEEYMKQFQNLLTEKTIGFAYTINGELYNLDLYCSVELFAELFEKLLTAAVVEAIAELDLTKTDFTYLSIDDVQEELKMNEDYNESAENLNNRTRWLTKEDANQIIFTSLDRKNDSKWVHRNIIIKDKHKDHSTEDYYSEDEFYYEEGEAVEDANYDQEWQEQK